MIRIRHVLILVLFVISVFGLFQIKFKVQNLHLEVAELKRSLEHEKNSIHVLKAEWAYLNQPERLQRLAEKYLNLREVQHDQIMIAKPNSYIIAQTKEVKFANNDIIPASTKARLVNSTKFSPIKWRYKERPDLNSKRHK